MHLLRIALPAHDELDIIHVGGFARAGLFNDWNEIAADLLPDVKKVSAQGLRMLGREDLSRHRCKEGVAPVPTR
ncbi:hypothetical protein REJC140_02111 [Pseudorhizobium endolithicum]|uniref:Uncharacterized protein n=1 Tax=Pseudorhizobium endolithicum TaxID=1191678 RepID=A0ABM8PXT4_9HYPH|nr:hypothetical protein REQ54_02578 [Rhizobium sp. Q54]CAD7054185.1 hypothetical protein REJC140_02111 [Pseudorhizobium endolithicum]